MLLKRARLAEAKLRGILASHEDQSKALVQAQQEGKSAACLMDVHKPQVRSAQRA